MKRGELYRVFNPTSKDPKKYRVFVIVSRQILLDSRFSSVICAPVYSAYDGLSTQISVGPSEGLKHESAVHCDALISLPKTLLTHFVGTVSPAKLPELDRALTEALELRPHP